MKKTLFKLISIVASAFLTYPTTTNAQVMAAGAGYTVFLCGTKIPMGVGSNNIGQLGNGTNTNISIVPVSPGTLSDVKAVVGGDEFTLFIKNDGSVWGTGSNRSGQLGDGTDTNRKNPVRAGSITGIVAASAGLNHTLLLKNDGTVYGCGDNGNYNLGDPSSQADKKTPTPITSLSNIVAVSAGGMHSLFLKNDGTVWVCGGNIDGQYGNGTTVYSTSPIQIPSLTGITAICASQSSIGAYCFSLFLKNDGTVWACGNNTYGQLGDGTTTQRKTPIQIPGLSGITAIVGARFHSLFLKNDGTVWACGYNASGQLGDGTTIDKKTVVQVSGLSNIKAIEAGWDHSLFLNNDGTISACGSNLAGNLGDGTQVNRLIPVKSSVMCNVGLSVSTTAKNDMVSISPNPANTEFILELPDYKNTVVELLNLQGQLINSFALQYAKTNVNISDLKTGLYFVKIKTPKYTKVERLIKN